MHIEVQIFFKERGSDEVTQFVHAERTDNFIMAFVQAIWAFCRHGLHVSTIHRIVVDYIDPQSEPRSC